MERVILSGSSGRMGKTIAELIKEDPNMEIVCGIDRQREKSDFPVFTNFEDCTIEGDVIIDFSHHSVTSGLLDFCLKTKTPLVLCTTGLDDNLIDKVNKVSKEVAIFRSGNMSLGINLIMDLAKKASKILANNFDIEIIEKHHNKKVDSPSGTAYMIADAINEELHNTKSYTYGRHGRSSKREENEIGIHAVRGGTIVGEHTVIFAGGDEIIEIKHSAMSRKVFATGAVKAAKFMIDKTEGIYDMMDILK